jgi:hypothetical protein
VALALVACGGSDVARQTTPSLPDGGSAAAATTIADPSSSFGLDPVVTSTTASDPLGDPRLAPNSADALWCVAHWDVPGNADARKQIVQLGKIDRVYAYRLTPDESGSAVEETLHPGACALTFAQDQDSENVGVVWFAERGSTGVFREVGELSGPAFSYFDPGNAAVGREGMLRPVDS